MQQIFDHFERYQVCVAHMMRVSSISEFICFYKVKSNANRVDTLLDPHELEVLSIWKI